MAGKKPSGFNANATYDQTKKWTEKQLAAGVPASELRKVADGQNRRRNGNSSAVDGIRHVTG